MDFGKYVTIYQNAFEEFTFIWFLPRAAIFWLDQLTLEFTEVARQGHVVVVCGPVDEQLEPGAILAQQQEDGLLLLGVQPSPAIMYAILVYFLYIV